MASNSTSEHPPPSLESKGNSQRTMSTSNASENSQTAAEFIRRQLQLEEDAREVLPYKFDACTRPLGSLRQLLFACLTCNPPPTESSNTYTPAGICYSCSVSCHGEHTLVELFNKRDFVCDCGTSRLPSTSPCTLRINPATNEKGGIFSELAEEKNKYNHNFQNRFCGCECDYDPHQQKGTMFQCLGLGTVADGGCGEDWWHPGCIVGLGPDWNDEATSTKRGNGKLAGILETITEAASAVVDVAAAATNTANDDASDDDDEADLPPGFPKEDDFEGFICYKCVDANPWIKAYAGSEGFLQPVFKRSTAPSPEAQSTAKTDSPEDRTDVKAADELFTTPSVESRKRKAEDSEIESSGLSKRFKEEDVNLNEKSISTATTGSLNKLDSSRTSQEAVVFSDSSSLADKPTPLKHDQLSTAPEGRISLFFKADFRDHLCRCNQCFSRLAKHPQLLEEEETYEPPISEDGDDGAGSTVGSGSLLDRGERALTNVDRVRAIEGVMAYNHLKEKLTPFFKEFAESGKAISAEDIKAHFAKMRGDEDAIKQAAEDATSSENNRREQSGY